MEMNKWSGYSNELINELVQYKLKKWGSRPSIVLGRGTVFRNTCPYYFILYIERKEESEKRVIEESGTIEKRQVFMRAFVVLICRLSLCRKIKVLPNFSILFTG